MRHLVQRLQRALASLHFGMIWCQLCSTVGTDLASLMLQLAAISKSTAASELGRLTEDQKRMIHGAVDVFNSSVGPLEGAA